MVEKIKRNKELLQKVNGLIKQEDPRYYHFMASMNALDINNDVIENFIKKADADLSQGECFVY